jgi:hypothetical protein
MFVMFAMLALICLVPVLLLGGGKKRVNGGGNAKDIASSPRQPETTERSSR